MTSYLQATQVLGAFLQKDQTLFEQWMSAKGDVTPHRSKQCAGALHDWCQACPQLKRADAQHEDEEMDTGSGSGAKAGPSRATVSSLSTQTGDQPYIVCLGPDGMLRV